MTMLLELCECAYCGCLMRPDDEPRERDGVAICSDTCEKLFEEEVKPMLVAAWRTVDRAFAPFNEWYTPWLAYKKGSEGK